METIDIKILEARKKPLTPENLNYLGDLYLKKEETDTALGYYHKAVEHLSYVQKDKKLAILKKIIKIAPSDLKAYTGIIDLFARLGITAEEIKYSYILADHYHKEGQYDHARRLYERIHELEPHNKIAESYLHTHQKKEQTMEPPATMELTGSEQPSVVTGPGDTKTISDEGAEYDSPDISEEKDNSETRTVVEVKGRAAEGIFTATIEGAPVRKSVQEKRTFYIPAKKSLYQRSIDYGRNALFMLKRSMGRKMLVYGGLGLVCLLLLIFVVPAAKRGLTPSEQAIRKRMNAEWIDNNVRMRTDNYEINMTMLTHELLERNDVLSMIDADTRMNYDFFTIAVTPLNGCLPERFASSPHAMISLLDDKTAIPLAESDLQKLNRVIYKADVCNKEFAPVFVRFYVNKHKELRSSSLSIGGLEKGDPLIIEW